MQAGVLVQRGSVKHSSQMDRLAINHITTRRWSLQEAIVGYAGLGVRGIGIWPDAAKAFGIVQTRQLLRQHGMLVSGYCCGNMFTARTPRSRREQLSRNRTLIDEAAALEAQCLVCVSGGLSEGNADLASARKWALDGLSQLVPFAREAGIAIGIEPIHPMRASDLCCITTLAEANALCDALGFGTGIVVDVYHVWWDPNLACELERARGRVVGVHLSDWLRSWEESKVGCGMIGDGVIDIRTIIQAVGCMGYTGLHEVELVSPIWGALDPIYVSQKCIERYRSHCL